MSEYVTDTHAFIWHLTNDPHLSGADKRAFIEADLAIASVPGLAVTW